MKIPKNIEWDESTRTKNNPTSDIEWDESTKVDFVDPNSIEWDESTQVYSPNMSQILSDIGPQPPKKNISQILSEKDTGTISAPKKQNLIESFVNKSLSFLKDPALAVSNLAKDIAGGAGSFIEAGSEAFLGGVIPETTSKLTNAFLSQVDKSRAQYGEAPVPKTTPEEVVQQAREQVKRKTGATSDVIDNKLIRGAGEFTGAVGGELLAGAMGMGLTKGMLQRSPWLVKAIEKTPGIAQALIRGSITGANVWGVKQALSPADREKGIKGLPTSMAIWGGGAVGSELMGAAIERLAPQLSKIPGMVKVTVTPQGTQTMQVNQYVEGILRESAENIVGSVLALPTISDEEKAQFIKEIGPDLLAEGFLDVLQNMMTKGSITVTIPNKTTDVALGDRVSKVEGLAKEIGQQVGVELSQGTPPPLFPRLQSTDSLAKNQVAEVTGTPRLSPETEARFTKAEDVLKKMFGEEQAKFILEEQAKLKDVVVTPKSTDGSLYFPDVDVSYADTKEGNYFDFKGSFKGANENDIKNYRNVKNPLPLPEIIDLVKGINDGKHPELVQAIGKGKSVGRFEDGNIYLREDSFIGSALEPAEFKPVDGGITPEEAFNQYKETILKYNEDADWDDITFKQEFDKKSGKYIYTSYLKDPEFASRVISHEIGHLVNVIPAKDIEGNTLGTIKEFKGSVDSHLETLDVATQQTITDELKALTKEWRNFDEAADPKYTEYRHSKEELLADGISALLTNPGMVDDIAPTYYKAIGEYVDADPAFGKVYNDLQTKLNDPELIAKHRDLKLTEMFEKGDKRRESLEVKAKKVDFPKMGDQMAKALIDKDWSFLKATKAGIKQGGDIQVKARKAQLELEESRYIASEINGYMQDINDKVLQPIFDNGFTINDIDNYVTHKTIVDGREGIANPGGLTKRESQEQLYIYKKALGEDRFKILEDLVESYQKERAYVFNRLEESGLFDKGEFTTKPPSIEFRYLDRAQENKYSYNQHKELQNVFKEVGDLGDIDRPFVSAVIQDISLLRAAKLNETKKTAIEFLSSTGEARKKRKGEFDSKRQGEATLSIMVDGNIETYYIDKEIAESFTKHPFETQEVTKLLAGLTAIERQIFVTRNPIWVARNTTKDFLGTYKQNSEVGFWALGKQYTKAWKEVWGDVFGDKPSQTIRDMKKGYMLNQDRVYTNKDVTFNNELERIAENWAASPKSAKEAETFKSKAKAWIVKYQPFSTNWGEFSEKLGKVAGYQALKSTGKLSEQELSHRVRTRVGTPDARRQGSWNQATNSIFMFSNIGKEGARSMVESVKDNPGSYAYRAMATNVLPKLAMYGVGQALVGMGIEWWQECLEKVPTYDKMNYNVVPLGITKDGKARYLRIPIDYEGQIWSALTQMIIERDFKVFGKEGVLSAAWDQANPYGMNPWLTAAMNLGNYYILGNNPIDDFTGQPIIPQTAYKAGIGASTPHMIKSTINTLGGSTITNLSSVDVPNRLFGGKISASDPWNKEAWSDPDKLEEQLLKTPGLNWLGAFIRYSDAGVTDEYYDEKNDNDKVKAQRSVAISSSIDRHIQDFKGVPTYDDIKALYNKLNKEDKLFDIRDKSLAQFKNDYVRHLGNLTKDRYLKVLIKTKSSERKALLEKWSKELPKEKYNKLVNYSKSLYL